MIDNIQTTPAINIGDIINSAILKEGSIVEATIKQIIDNNNYLLNVQGLLLEVAIPLMLKQGDKLTLKIAQLTNDRIVLNILSESTKNLNIDGLEPILHITESDITALLNKLSVPATDLNKNISVALIRQNAPITPEAIEKISDIVSKAQTTQEEKISASAFLLSKGIQPTTDLIDNLTNRGLGLQNANTSDKTEIVRTALEFVKSISLLLDGKQTQKTIPETSLTDFLASNVKDAIKTVLDNSPQLRLIDSALELISQKLENATTSKEDLTLANTAFNLLVNKLALLKQGNPDKAEIPIDVKTAIETMNKGTLELLKSRFADLEKKEIASNPILSQARTEKGQAFEIIDRMAFNRLINQIGAIKEDGKYISQLIVRIDGATTFIPIRISHYKQGKGKKYSKPLTNFALDIDMSKIGKIQVIANIAAKNIDIKFKVRRKTTKELFKKHELELKTALQDMGYEAIAVSTDISEKVGKEKVFSHLPEDGHKPYISVDIKV